MVCALLDSVHTCMTRYNPERAGCFHKQRRVDEKNGLLGLPCLELVPSCISSSKLPPGQYLLPGGTQLRSSCHPLGPHHISPTSLKLLPCPPPLHPALPEVCTPAGNSPLFFPSGALSCPGQRQKPSSHSEWQRETGSQTVGSTLAGGWQRASQKCKARAQVLLGVELVPPDIHMLFLPPPLPHNLMDAKT